MKRLNYNRLKYFIFGVYGSLIALFCFFTVLYIHQNIERSEKRLKQMNQKSEFLDKVTTLHWDFAHIANIQENSGKLLQKNLKKANQFIQYLNLMDEQEQKEYEDFFYSTKEFQVLFEALIIEIQEKYDFEEIQEIQAKIQNILDANLVIIMKKKHQNFKALEATNAHFIGIFQTIKISIILFSIVVIIIVIMSGISLTRALGKPIAELVQAAEELRSGNLEYSLDVLNTPRDAPGILMRNFNIMAKRLAHMTSKLEKTNALLRKEADQLTEADAHKNTFIRHLGHELRAPLSSIIGFSELMQEGRYGDLTVKQEESIGRIHKSATHLLELINDLVDSAKLQAGALSLEKKSCKIVEFVNGIFHSFEAVAQKESVNFKADFRGISHDFEIELDEKRTRQVITNLISNAIKFTPNGGDIHLSIHINNQNLLISIKDSGIGIDKKDQERIFEEFQQVQNSHSSKGAGIGLALSQKIAELHEGKIIVESALNTGSTFTLYLPMSIENKI